jgi:hypothetical protein
MELEAVASDETAKHLGRSQTDYVSGSLQAYAQGHVGLDITPCAICQDGESHRLQAPAP